MSLTPFESEQAAVKAMEKAQEGYVAAFGAALKQVPDESCVDPVEYAAGCERLMELQREHAVAVYRQAKAQGFNVPCWDTFKAAT